MDFILNQIERALDKNLHYLAVASALTLPDLCGALEAEDGIARPAHYKTWYDKWLAPKYDVITSQDLYMLRCGVLH